jgi:WD40 repeat protein
VPVAIVALLTLAVQVDAQALPAGAIRRIGTPTHWSAYPHQVYVLADDGTLTLAEEGHRVVAAPDGGLSTIITDNHYLHLVDRDGVEVRKLAGHTAYLAAAAFTPDGRLVASGSNDRTLRLWDVATGKELHICRGHGDQVCAIAFAPDGKTIASASWDGTLRLWDVATGKELRCFTGHHCEALGVAFLSNGRIVSCGIDGTMRIWDIANGKERRRWKVHESGVRAVALAKDGKGVYSVDGNGTMQIWDVESAGEPQPKPFSPKSTQVGGRPNTPRSEMEPDGVHSAVFAPNGKTIALGHYSGTIRLCDAETGKVLRVVGRHPGIVWGLAFSPDGKTLASSARRHGVVRLWDVETGALVRSYPGHGGGISRVLFTRDGQRLIAAGGSFDPVIIVHETATAKTVHRLAGHTNYVDDIALTPDGTALASCAWDGIVRLWALDQGRELRRWQASEEHRGRVGFTADGSLLAVDASGETCVFDAATGRARRRLTRASNWMALSADGRSAAVLTPEQAIEVVEMATDGIRRQFKPLELGQFGGVQSMTFSRDGRRLLTSLGDGTAVLWDLTGGVAKAPPGNEHSLWDDLASVNGASAHSALWRLALMPSETVARLRHELQPAKIADSTRMTRLLAQLDDDDFAVRQKATADLEAAGEGARTVLEEVLMKPGSLELKRRAEGLLARLDIAPPPRDTLRALRALEVLESIGTPEARRIVATLAQGASGARLTREARWTLARWP